ncbi:MAG: hypothetical protein JJE55_06800 [Flavobacteriaceae bacterium]|nr:hypothetical protein [Flavobacteriaceae bacterium]
MKYYKAYETDDRPFLLFDLVADTLEELQELGMDTDPLVVTKDQLLLPADPNYISYEYGICHKRIFGGVIADRLAGEITDQQAALAKATEVARSKSLTGIFETETFTYDSHDFPLTEAARSVYNAVFDAPAADCGLVSTTGNYTLLSANIGAFQTAYLNKILAVQYILSPA